MRGITAFILAFAAFVHVRGAMLQMELYLGDERCVGHELDEDDEATFKVAATSKSAESDKQQLVVTVRFPCCHRLPPVCLIAFRCTVL